MGIIHVFAEEGRRRYMVPNENLLGLATTLLDPALTSRFRTNDAGTGRDPAPKLACAGFNVLDAAAKVKQRTYPKSQDTENETTIHPASKATKRI